jgi:hypothetical protein
MNKIAKKGILELDGQGSGQDKVTLMRSELGRFLEGNSCHHKIIESREELIEAVLEYFTKCDTEGKAPTMTGLGLALGFKSRNTIINYAKTDGYEFAHDVIAYARMQIEAYLEQRLLDPKNANVAGVIFNLKNNFNWTDKQEIKMDQRTIQLTGFKMIRNDDSTDSTE